MSDDLKARFEAAAEASKQLSRRPDNETLLKLYAYFKQATVGDVAGKRPGMLDMVGRAKYDAWAGIKGTAADSAMQSYIDLVERLKQQG
jgi:diazepam-binding inhibitor (GABA receptor modulating acyl-CoA-binding protein)